MPDIDFNALFNTLKIGVTQLATTSLKDYVNQAKTDGENILNTLKGNIEEWANQLKNKEITPDELEFLIGSQEANLKMVALKQMGIAVAEMDKFKKGIIELITKTLTGII